MANVKITELTAATALAGTDVLPIVDVGADATKKVSVSDLLRNLPDGTASAPALAFADDQNTGVLSPGDNSLAFATSGTQRLLIDSAGKFGFGTSTVSTAKFTFNSAGTNEVARFESTDAGAYLSLKDSTSSSSNFIEGGADQLSFGTNSNERLRIDSNGRVGIGTTSPENNLHIADTSGPIIRLTNSTGTDGTYTGRISTGDAAGTFFAGINFFKHDTNDGEIRFRTKVAGTNQDTVTIVDGNVGIGTTSPGSESFVVQRSGSTPTIRINAASSYEAQLKLQADGTVTDTQLVAAKTDGSLAFARWTGAAYSERMRIDSSGRLLLGTTTEGAAGADNLTVADSGTCGITIRSGTSSNGNIYFSDATSGTGEFAGYIQYRHGDNALAFGDSSAERVRIDSSGRVLIGATSSYASSNADDLQVGDNTSSGQTGITLGSTTASSIRFRDGADAGIILYLHSDNSMRFSTVDTEAMRIDSSGRLLLGSTSAIVSGALDNSLHLKSPNGPEIYFLRDDSGSTVAGNALGMLRFYGNDNDGTAQESARIECEADLDHGNNDKPGRLLFLTTADNASSPTERARIDSKGRVLINSTAAATDNSFLTVQNSSGACEVNIMSGPSGASVINLGDTGDYNIGRIKYDQSTNSLQFNTNNSERMRINSSGQVLIGQTSATSVLGNGVGIKSNAVGSDYNEGALALTGTGGDFYGLTFSKTGNNDAEGFGFLSVFSSATDNLQIGYNNGSSDTNIATFYQNGNVNVAGALSKGSGSFRINHPLPAKTETHDLVHSFVEGPQADLIYRGKVDLVAGAATVNLDTAARMTEGTFALLNTNVQCFTSNESDWTAVRGSVSGNTLTIAAEDNTSTATVSWLVIGERQDQHMLDTDWTDDNGRVITEPEKPS